MKQSLLGALAALTLACGVPDERQCDPGTPASCDGATLSLCVEADGLGFIVTQTCGAGTTCDADSGSCLGGGGDPFCGDGNLDAGEACDDGNNANGDACNADCSLPKCGDGITGNTPNEECDDGNGNNNDACANDCTVNIPPGCGNGSLDAGEACDDGNNLHNDTCDGNCSLPKCGNGITAQDGAGVTEQCDDGNTINGDGCDDTCKFEAALPPFCGNGNTDAGEQCDEGAPNNNGITCNSNCTLPTCGDGLTGNTAGEECDDGNNNNGDGCSATCLFEAVAGAICGNNLIEGAEDCDDGNTNDNDGCEGDCTFACGAEFNPLSAALNASTGTCYVSFQQTLDWFTAEASCEAKGGYLVVPDDAAEDALLQATILPTAGFNMWIGLFDFNVEATSNGLGYEKITGGLGGFNNFRPGEPSDNGGNGEDCIVYGGPQWNDFFCNSTVDIFTFACEIEAVSCGDGVTQAALGEECDDGNNFNGDDCNSDCTQPRCGDGIAQDGEVCFVPANNFPAGNAVFSITSADFNEDGLLDIITANFNDNNDTILFGKPDGTFGTPIVIGTGATPTRGAAADLNNDGHQDYIVANFSGGNMGIFLGNGDGTFQAQTNLNGLGFPISFDVVDLDNDGDLDLMVGNAQNGNPNVSRFNNNGDGTFSAAININTGTTGVRGVRVQDFNGDGKLDIAASGADANQPMNILTGDGAGNFVLGSTNPVNSGGEPVAGDFNNDGRADLVIGQNDNTLRVFINNGNAAPNFTATTINLVDAANDVNVGDFNNDGNLDIAANVFIFEVKSTMAIILGNGNGTFQAPRFLPAGNTGIATVVEPRDYNRDGRLDIATRDGANGERVQILWGIGDGNFAGEQRLTTSSNLPINIASGDIDNDGDDDFVTIHDTPTNALNVLLNDGTGSFTAGQVLSTGNAPTTVALADLNRDGNLDIAVTNFLDPTVNIFLGNGNGTFAASTSITLGAAGARDSVIVDLNRDGKLDVVTTLGDTELLSVALAAAVGFNAPTLISVDNNNAFFTSSVGIKTGDFNQDGIPDLAIANQVGAADGLGNVSIFLTNNAGVPVFSTFLTAGLGPVDSAVGDFNSDGRDDLAITNGGDNTVSLLLNAGGGSFTRTNFATGANPTRLVAADVNTDGALDLVINNLGAPNLSVLLGDGAGSFSPAISFPTASNPFGIATGDFNSDGAPDFATANLNTSSVSLFSSFFR